MVRKLAALALLGVALAGCSPEPQSPSMSPEQEAKARDQAYTPEQKAQRAQRPR